MLIYSYIQDFFVAIQRMIMGARLLRNWLSVELEKHPWLKSFVAQIFPLTDVNQEFKHGQIVTYLIWFMIICLICKYQGNSVWPPLKWTIRCMTFEVFAAWVYETFGFAMVG